MKHFSIRFITGLLLSAMIGLPWAALAQEAPPLAPLHDFSISAVVSYLDYEEDSIDVSIEGPMAGVAARYDYHSDTSRWMFGLQAELDYGSLDYDGSTMGGIPVSEDSDDTIFETRALAGLDFEPGPDWLLTPFLGLGFRYWYNDVSGAGSYTREVSYLYLPLGLEVAHNLGAGWRLRLAAEGDVLLSGQVNSALSDVDSGFNDTTNTTDFGDGWGARVSLEARTRHFSIEPYFRYWDIDESDTDALTYYGYPTGYVVYEPSNTTTVFGIQVGYHF